MSENISPETQALSIVVVGRFNPAIFHPLWFSNFNIFSQTDVNEAKDTFNVVHRDIANFQIDWCHFNVTENRFMVLTRMDAYFERLRDLVVQSFDHLHHTPVKALGINPEADFNLRTDEKWHNFGHRFAPKDDWKAITDNPGLQELIIKDETKKGDYEGYSLIKLRPSEKLNYGLFINLNEHFELGEFDPQNGTKKLLEVLNSQFLPTLEKWKKIHNHLTSLV